MAQYLISSLKETGDALRREFQGYISEGYYYDGYSQFDIWKIGDLVTNFFDIDYLNLLTKLKAEEYPFAILRYYQHAIHNKSVRQIYAYYSPKELANKYAKVYTKLNGINLYFIHTANSFLIYPVYNLTNLIRDLNEEIRLLEGEIKFNSRRKGVYEIKYTKFVKCDGTNLPLSLEEKKNKKAKLSVLDKAYTNIISKLSDIESQFFNAQEDKINKFNELYSNYKVSSENISKYIDFMLSDSIYSFFIIRPLILNMTIRQIS